MAVNKEEELYQPLKIFYQQLGYEVKSEVLHCDLVAIHPENGHTVIVEMKKTFNLALLLQGLERLRLHADVVLAVERNRKKSGAVNQRFGDLTELCRMLGIGLITVTFYKTKSPVIDILCEPGDMPVRNKRRTKAARLQTEFKERSGDYNTGGSTGRKLVTAYREKSLRIAYVLGKLGEAAPRQIASLTKNPKTAQFLQHNYYGWFERVQRGIYKNTPEGNAALEQYKDVIGEWSLSISCEL